MHRRYKDAEQAFQRSCRLEDEEMALTDRLTAYKGVVEQLVSHFSVESEPSIYAESFEKLSNWVDNALDMYRVCALLCLHVPVRASVCCTYAHMHCLFA